MREQLLDLRSSVLFRLLSPVIFLLDADAWIKDGVSDISQSIEDNDGEAGQDDTGLQDRIITLTDSIKGKLTSPGDLEKPLGDVDAGHQITK